MLPGLSAGMGSRVPSDKGRHICGCHTRADVRTSPHKVGSCHRNSAACRYVGHTPSCAHICARTERSPHSTVRDDESHRTGTCAPPRGGKYHTDPCDTAAHTGERHTQESYRTSHHMGLHPGRYRPTLRISCRRDRSVPPPSCMIRMPPRDRSYRRRGTRKRASSHKENRTYSQRHCRRATEMPSRNGTSVRSCDGTRHTHQHDRPCHSDVPRTQGPLRTRCCTSVVWIRIGAERRACRSGRAGRASAGMGGMDPDGREEDSGAHIRQGAPDHIPRRTSGVQAMGPATDRPPFRRSTRISTADESGCHTRHGTWDNTTPWADPAGRTAHQLHANRDSPPSQAPCGLCHHAPTPAHM
eukprot:Opistho-2@27675